MNPVYFPLKSFLITILLAVFLIACGTTTQQQTTTTAEQVLTEADATQSIIEGRTLAAVRIYNKLAVSSQNEAQKQGYQLRAIEALFNAGYPELALDKLEALSSDTATPELQQRRQIADARAAIAIGEPLKALELIPNKTSALSLSSQQQALEARAQAYTALKQTEDSLQTRIALEPLLTAPSSIDNNHKKIWRLLSQLPDIELASLSSFGRGSVYQGWVELAQTALNTRQHLKTTLPVWVQRFPEHPAAEHFVLALIDETEAIIPQRNQIALLLPLEGKLGKVAAAVRDGFLTAYYSDNSGEAPDIRIYSTSNNGGDFRKQYAQAIQDGARAVIGPLDKASVGLLAVMPALPVPTLALNYHEDSTVQTSENLFQFGLLPEDEARAAAEFAITQGHTNAVAMVANNAWGTRMLDAFNQRLLELGGTLLDHQSYELGSHDFSQPIKRVFNLDRSQSRKSILQSILGSKLEFQPHRRQDMDFIFLAAPAKVARQIKPQFKFHYGNNTPIYATSRAYSGERNSRKNNDLNGLLICDVPWLLTDARENSRLYQQVNRLWPQQGSLARLYALGIDAYNLLPHLGEMASDPHYTYPGRTGDLTLNQGNRVQRHLHWAQFIKGQAVTLIETLNEDGELHAAPLESDG